MSNAMRKGSLLVVLAAICAMTLMWSPTHTYADGTGGQTAWTDDSPGGSTNGDPDLPTKGSGGSGTVTSQSTSYYGPRQSVSVGYSVTLSGVSLRDWWQPLMWGLRSRLGLYW